MPDQSTPFPPLGMTMHPDGHYAVANGQNVTLGDEFHFEPECEIHDHAAVEIQSNTIVSRGVKIYSGAIPLGIDIPVARGTSGPVKIESKVWIGEGVVIAPGTQIGRGSVIAAGSVVVGNIPANSLAAGVPCRIVRPIKAHD
jgi:acetyltransferase-like isoleucine patch superfamily enzyme